MQYEIGDIVQWAYALKHVPNSRAARPYVVLGFTSDKITVMSSEGKVETTDIWNVVQKRVRGKKTNVVKQTLCWLPIGNSMYVPEDDE